eukprot:PLAT5478.2.p1 GENE.PLAT5478.2~~PLAT5478.2.p1  ORF type:complete len:466 (+),score=141.18 PLAT5478.2:136-1398(+)
MSSKRIPALTLDGEEDSSSESPAAPSAAAISSGESSGGDAVEKEGPRIAQRRALAVAYACERATWRQSLNSGLRAALKELISFYDCAGTEDVYERKSLVWSRVLAVVRAAPFQLRSADDLAGVPFVGASARAAIDAYLTGGELPRLTAFRRSAEHRSRRALCRVWGIGAGTAGKLLAAGIRTVRQAQEAAGKLPLRSEVRLCLRHFQQLTTPMQRSDAQWLRDRVSTAAAAAYGQRVEIAIVGGYRRGGLTMKDVDLLLRIPPDISYASCLTPLLTELEAAAVVTAVLHSYHCAHALPYVLPPRPSPSTAGAAFSRHKFDAFSKAFCLARLPKGRLARLDIVLAPDCQWPYALLGWTGSRLFNRDMRRLAKDKLRLHLTSHGFMGDDAAMAVVKAADVTEEKHVFALLGLKYLPPEARCA